MPFKSNKKKVEKEILNDTSRGIAKAAMILQSQIKQELSKSQSPAGINQPPGVKTGALRRSISAVKVNNFKYQVGTNLPYAALEYGAIISAKNYDYLKFKIQGQWISKKTVKINPHPFMRPSLEKAKDKMTKAIIVENKK